MIAICGSGPHHPVSVKQDGTKRWCFRCRIQTVFNHVVWSPNTISYYGPFSEIQCSLCGGIDADLFPGRTREWND